MFCIFILDEMARRGPRSADESATRYLLVSSSDDGELRIFDFATRTQIHAMKIGAAIDRISINPRNVLEVAASCGENGLQFADIASDDVNGLSCTWCVNSLWRL